MLEIKSEADFLLMSRTFYSNGQGNMEKDLEIDLKRIGNLKYQLGKYHMDGTYNLRFMLNHFIILYNVFGQITLEMLRFKSKPKFYPYINTLGRVLGASTDQPIDKKLLKILQNEIA